jgi:hypothetical protein
MPDGITEWEFTGDVASWINGIPAEGKPRITHSSVVKLSLVSDCTAAGRSVTNMLTAHEQHVMSQKVSSSEET